MSNSARRRTIFLGYLRSWGFFCDSRAAASAVPALLVASRVSSCAFGDRSSSVTQELRPQRYMLRWSLRVSLHVSSQSLNHVLPVTGLSCACRVQMHQKLAAVALATHYLPLQGSYLGLQSCSRIFRRSQLDRRQLLCQSAYGTVDAIADKCVRSVHSYINWNMITAG
ncbi:hypothetical protein FKP32DRAFT_1161485 [Trametes sanguinea]|nr:hypothetical protein FKP32DRAFT_1161485 [Trametes sanguinea]